MTHEPFDVVIYHGNCCDGFTAAWIAWMHSPAAVFHPAQYGDEHPDVVGKRVLIVDFSYPREVLLRLYKEAADLLVLDHHKTAAADLADLNFAVFDMERSGAGLAWDYLIGGVRPPMVDAVEDRDLWRFRYSSTRAVHAAMSTREMTFDNWEAMTARSLADLMREGEGILRFTRLTAEKFASRAGTSTVAGTAMWSVNVPAEFVSETAEVLKEREPHMPVLGWSWDGERGDFLCSLRSRDDGPDVSAIAKRFGGGGHEHAAGFRVERCPAEMFADV